MEPLRPLAVAAIVPVLNEVDAIGDVVGGLLAAGVGRVLVIDVGSTDGTAEVAQGAGAAVILERRRGYGRAMMTGIAALPETVEIVLFFDGDGSDRPDLVPTVLAPILDGSADFAMGSRTCGDREPGSLGFTQIIAARLAGGLMRVAYGARFSDMSPFRAMRRDVLAGLDMREETFGWNLEMQMKVAAAGLRIVEGTKAWPSAMLPTNPPR